MTVSEDARTGKGGDLVSSVADFKHPLCNPRYTRFSVSASQRRWAQEILPLPSLVFLNALAGCKLSLCLFGTALSCRFSHTELLRQRPTHHLALHENPVELKDALRVHHSQVGNPLLSTIPLKVTGPSAPPSRSGPLAPRNFDLAFPVVTSSRRER